MDTQQIIERGKLAELEQKFVAAKAAGKLTNKLRHELREARRAYRDRWRPVDPNGAQPTTVTSKAKAR